MAFIFFYIFIPVILVKSDVYIFSLAQTINAGQNTFYGFLLVYCLHVFAEVMSLHFPRIKDNEWVLNRMKRWLMVGKRERPVASERGWVEFQSCRQSDLALTTILRFE